MTCPVCKQVTCDDPDDTKLYSLESELFPFVINCPPGFDCNNHTYFKLVCCDQVLTTQWENGTDVAVIEALIAALVQQCDVIWSFCREKPPVLYYNSPQSCTTFCPDGSAYTFNVPAGSFAAAKQADADAEAEAYACQQAGLRLMCFTPFTACICVGSSFSTTLSMVGGIAPITFSVVGGALPTGLHLSSGGVISGTATAHGQFTFSIQATASDGSFVVKSFGITVLTISTTALPAYEIGVPYSYQLQAAGGSGNYSWALVSGTLPNGLILNSNGLISGTPV